MVIDVAYIILLAIAIFKGYSRGFIVAIFSFFAIMVALAAAIKLSAVTANWLLRHTTFSGKYIPFIAFLLILMLSAFCVRLIANVVQKTLDILLVGWLNRVAGVFLYACIYTFVYSIILFYATKMFILTSSTVKDSFTFGFIEPWGPFAINALASILPIFKNVFQQLEAFFAGFTA